MKRYIAMALLFAGTAGAGAQTPDSVPRSDRAEHQVITEQRRVVEQQRRVLREERLRTRIQERFTQRVAESLELQQDQLTRLRATNARFGARRAELERNLVQLRQSLRSELKPGVAANDDSVSRVVDRLLQAQLERARIEQDEMKELSSFLSPVQRAKYLIMQQRMRQLIEEAADKR